MARGLHVHNTAGASDAGSKKKMSVYTHAVDSKEYGAILWLVLELWAMIGRKILV